MLKQFWEYWKSVKMTNYWHAEIIFIVPLGLYAIWRIETIVSLLQHIAAR